MIYFVQAATGEVKIGHTDDLRKRLGQLQVGQAHPLRLARRLSGSEQAERWLHQRYAHLRIGGEWFRYDPDMQTVELPDFPPEPARPEPYRSKSLGEFFSNAAALGLLSPREMEETAPLREAVGK